MILFVTSDTSRHDRPVPKDAKYFENKSGDFECQICHDVGMKNIYKTKKGSKRMHVNMVRHTFSDHQKKLDLEKWRKITVQNPNS